MSQTKFEQTTFPDFVRPKAEVRWFNAELVREKRWLFGHKVIAQLLPRRAMEIAPTSVIDAEDISKLTDPNLRYALTFQDAANAMGYIVDGAIGLQVGHYVNVYATDEGFDSKLLSATYTGVKSEGRDTFMEFLVAAGEDHIDEAVRAASQNGE